MKSTTQYLQEKGLVEKGFTEFVIRFNDGRERVTLNELLAEYAKECLEEVHKKIGPDYKDDLNIQASFMMTIDNLK